MTALLADILPWGHIYFTCLPVATKLPRRQWGEGAGSALVVPSYCTVSRAAADSAWAGCVAGREGVA